MTNKIISDELLDAELVVRTFTFDGVDSSRARKALETIMTALRQAAPGGGDEPIGKPVAVAAALIRRLCQMFDSGGESQRSARARHASAAFQLLDGGASEYLAEQNKCDADPLSYLEAAEDYALSRPLAALPQEAPAQAQEAREWQSMDTAPKDREIIGLESDGRIFNLRWEPDDCGENWYDVHGDQLAYPTCWTPMPYFVLKAPAVEVVAPAERGPSL